MGAFVLNERQEVLCVQEAHGPLRGKVCICGVAPAAWNKRVNVTLACEMVILAQMLPQPTFQTVSKGPAVQKGQSCCGGHRIDSSCLHVPH